MGGPGRGAGRARRPGHRGPLAREECGGRPSTGSGLARQRSRRGVFGLVLHGAVDDSRPAGPGLGRPHQHRDTHGQGHDRRGHRYGCRGFDAGGGAGAGPAGARDPDAHIRHLDLRRHHVVGWWRGRVADVAGVLGLGRGAVPEQHLATVVLPKWRDHGIERTVRVALQPDLDARRGRPELHHLQGRGPSHQLPGDRARSRPDPGREHRPVRAGPGERRHHRLDAHRTSGGQRIAAADGERIGAGHRPRYAQMSSGSGRFPGRRRSARDPRRSTSSIPGRSQRR